MLVNDQSINKDVNFDHAARTIVVAAVLAETAMLGETAAEFGLQDNIQQST